MFSQLHYSRRHAKLEISGILHCDGWLRRLWQSHHRHGSLPGVPSKQQAVTSHRSGLLGGGGGGGWVVHAVAGFLGWGFLISNPWNCSDAAGCTKANNWGWRYTMFTGGALVFVMSVLRVTVTVIKVKETPKCLLGVGDESPS